MESQQENVAIDDVSRGSGVVAVGCGETCDSFDSELHLVSVENMLSLGELISLPGSEIVT
jgi:hypothetical protein